MGSLDRQQGTVTGVTAMLVLGAGFVALFAGLDWFWMVWVVGFAVLVPIVAILTGEDEDEDEDEDRRSRTRRDEADEPGTDVDTEAALATLRDRYARGDLSDEQFERKLGVLLETETTEAAREHARQAAARADREHDANRR